MEALREEPSFAAPFFYCVPDHLIRKEAGASDVSGGGAGALRLRGQRLSSQRIDQAIGIGSRM